MLATYAFAMKVEIMERMCNMYATENNYAKGN